MVPFVKILFFFFLGFFSIVGKHNYLLCKKLRFCDIFISFIKILSLSKKNCEYRAIRKLAMKHSSTQLFLKYVFIQ